MQSISKAQTDIKLSIPTSGDITTLCQLFRSSFNMDIDEQFWNWKYGEDRGHNIIAEIDGKIVAHYGGMKRSVVWKNETIPSIQCVDTMVNASGRSSIARDGPYKRVAQRFLDEYVGQNRPYLFGFGFPNERVMRLGEILGIQADVGTIVEPWWNTDSRELDHSPNYPEVCFDPDKHTGILDKLWSNMWDKFPDSILCVRNAKTIVHRYVDHPTHDYVINIVFDVENNNPLGAYVLRNQISSILLLDLIGDPKYFPILIDSARRASASSQFAEMSAWISESHIEHLGDNIRNLNYPGVRIPTSVCTPGPAPSTLHNRWCLMAGDTDFK